MMKTVRTKGGEKIRENEKRERREKVLLMCYDATLMNVNVLMRRSALACLVFIESRQGGWDRIGWIGLYDTYVFDLLFPELVYYTGICSYGGWIVIPRVPTKEIC